MDEGILCVDDDLQLLEALRRHLGRWHAIGTASHPRQALRLLEEGGWAVVVSDYSMPDMDGVTLLRAIRERRPEVVRILLTGQEDPAVAARAVNEAGVFRLLFKPAGVEQLGEALEAALRQHRQALQGKG